jgi:hypothetical protein
MRGTTSELVQRGDVPTAAGFWRRARALKPEQIALMVEFVSRAAVVS